MLSIFLTTLGVLASLFLIVLLIELIMAMVDGFGDKTAEEEEDIDKT